MPRWIISEEFADLPECDGYLPLSLCFSQFAAVEVDLDPLNRDGLAQKLSEASPAQEVMRWHVRLLQSGELASVRRALGGGPLSPMPRSHWHADDVARRFVTSTYSAAEPYKADAPADSWIFVSDTDFMRLWDEWKAHLLADVEPKPEPRARRALPSAAANDVAPGLIAPAMMLSLPEVENLVGLKKSKLYEMIEAGDFPAQVKIGSKSLWPRQDIEEWIERQRLAQRSPPRA